MYKRWFQLTLLFGILCLAACARPGGGSPANDDGGAGLPVTEHAERATLTPDECEARGGMIMGDPGDGRIHRPAYRCPNGQPPLATVRYETGEMIPIEGSVCCPQ